MIPVVYRASFSYLIRHPWQLALAVLGIGIGVAVIVAVDLANDSARKAFLLSMDAATGEVTHQIVGGPRGIDEEVYVALRVEHGVRRIAPVVEGSIHVNGQALHLLGVDLFAEREMRSFTRPHTGRSSSDADTDAVRSRVRDMLIRPGAVMMSANTADSLGLVVGQPFEIAAEGRAYSASLVGTFGDGTATHLDNLITSDIASAQIWLDQPGWLSRIDVRLADGDDASRERLEGLLPADARLLTSAGRTRTTAELSTAFMTNLTAMSLLALLVGLFLIYNSVSFSVLQRRRLIGILRALGVTRRQAFALVLTESAAIGLFAAFAGVAAGIVLGEQLLGLVSQSINDFYFRVSVTEVTVSPVSVTKGLLAGIGATLAAAAVPAIEAASYPPRLAMSRSVLEQRARRLLPAVATAGVMMMGLAGLVLTFSGRSLIAGLAAVFMLILGFALCIPVAVKTLSSALAPIAGMLGGVWARLAIMDIGASLSRTAVAIVALAVAVSATIGVTLMVDSFRGSVDAWLLQTLQADIYAGVRGGDFDRGLFEDIANLQGVESVSTSRRVSLESASGQTRIQVLDMAPGSYAGTEILDAGPDEVWADLDRDDVVLVSEPYAYRNRVTAGDEVSLRTAAGEKPFRVAAIFQSYDINASALLMSRATYDRHFDDPGIDSVGLYVADGVGIEALIARLRTISAGRQELLISSNLGIRERSLEIFDRTFVITGVLYWLASGVAFIGILGAMLAQQLERARDLAVLRALGMTPLQLGGMITLQTSVIGLFSGLAAIPLGLMMGYVLIEVINRRAFGWQIDMAIASGTILFAAVFAVTAALLAGIYPAIRAARSQPAVAMREE